MKLSNLTAKLTCMKSTAVRVLAAATLAGAVLAAAPAAQAQRFAVGVRIGEPGYFPPPAPRYEGPVYAPRFDDHRFDAPRYDDRRFFEERRAHDEWLRHQEWERFHHDRFYGPRY